MITVMIVASHKLDPTGYLWRLTRMPNADSSDMRGGMFIVIC